MSEPMTFRTCEMGGVYLIGEWPAHTKMTADGLENFCEFQWSGGQLHILVDNATAIYEVEGVAYGDILLRRVYGKRR